MASVTVTGIEQLAKTFEAIPARLHLKVLSKGLVAAAEPMLKVARVNAAKFARSWELGGGRTMTVAGGSKRRTGPHLFASLGTRAKVFTYGQTSFVAAGAVYPAAAHAHLLEFGHRMVVGGTIKRIPPEGLTRFKVFRALRSGRGYWTYSSLRSTPGSAWTNEKVWMPRIGGGGVFAYLHGRPGTTPKSKRTGERGGGRVVGQVPGRPWMGPAFSSTQTQMLAAMVTVCNENIEKECAKVAKEFGGVV